MLRHFTAPLLLVAGMFLAQPASAAEPPIAQVMNEGLQAGRLMELEQDLTARLAANADDTTRFALGATQFIRTIERLSQNMYRYGLSAPRELERELPFFRFPLPPNPSPEHLDYEKMRDVFKEALSGFARVDTTLAAMGSGDIKLPVAIGLARLDLNGDGTADEGERLWRVFNASLGGGALQPEMAEHFVIAFDRADASWLRGYSHLLSALIELMLAHDGKASFDISAHMLFPGAGLPNAALDQVQGVENPYFNPNPFADAIAAIHLMHWEVREPERMAAALAHLETVSATSRESWRHILAETDDEAEWIPSPRQKNGAMPGVAISQQTVDGWMMFLDEFDAILAGRKLVPHWRFAKGINIRRAMLEEKVFDPILWAQGSAALPFLEDGPVTDAQTWMRIMGMFEGNFLGFAVWFN